MSQKNGKFAVRADSTFYATLLCTILTGGCHTPRIPFVVVLLVGLCCLTFSHCASSNGSSKRLHKRMHNCTGCICLTFPHCASSNGSSKRLHKRMPICTGCISLTFLHCVFSNGSSNCPGGCIITLVAFV